MSDNNTPDAPREVISMDQATIEKLYFSIDTLHSALCRLFLEPERQEIMGLIQTSVTTIHSLGFKVEFIRNPLRVIVKRKEAAK